VAFGHLGISSTFDSWEGGGSRPRRKGKARNSLRYLADSAVRGCGKKLKEGGGKIKPLRQSGGRSTLKKGGS